MHEDTKMHAHNLGHTYHRRVTNAQYVSQKQLELQCFVV